MKQQDDKKNNPLFPLWFVVPIAIIAITGVSVWTIVNISQKPLIGLFDNDNVIAASVVSYALGYSLMPLILASIILFRRRKQKIHLAVKLVVISSIVLYSLIFSIGSIHTDQYRLEQDYIKENPE